MYDVDGATGCWNWLGSLSSNGYGVKHIGRTSTAAHRFVYLQHKGPIPQGLELDHLCRNKKCVNPDHLEPVTRAENMRRHAPFDPRKQSAICKKGHPLDGTRTREGGGRYCKTCNAESKRRQRARLAAA